MINSVNVEKYHRNVGTIHLSGDLCANDLFKFLYEHEIETDYITFIFCNSANSQISDIADKAKAARVIADYYEHVVKFASQKANEGLVRYAKDIIDALDMVSFEFN